MKTFLAVAETGTFHNAAERLHVTQAAVSSRIRALEEAVGAALFLRGVGGTRLSAAGESLRPYAEQMLSSWDHVVGSIGRDHATRMALRLGCQLSIWDQMLVDLTIWAEEHLGKLPMTLNFDHDTNGLELVRRGVVDLIITHETPGGTRLMAQALKPERIMLVADRPCSLSDDELPLFLNFQLGPEYDARVGEVLGDRSGHLFLGNAGMGLYYMKKRGGMAFCPAAMVAAELTQKHLYPVGEAVEFSIPRFAVFDPMSPSADLVRQVLPGLPLET